MFLQGFGCQSEKLIKIVNDIDYWYINICIT